MIYHGAVTLSDLSSTVQSTVAALKPYRRRYDSIVVTGLSGVIVGIPVSLATGIPVVIVRKPSDDHHGWDGIINLESIGKRYIVVDDFTSSGATLKRIRAEIDARTCAVYVGAYCYGSMHNEEPDGFKWARKPRAAASTK